MRGKLFLFSTVTVKSARRNLFSDLLANFPECDSRVGRRDLFAVDDFCLFEPLVRLTQLDGLAVGRLVAELGERLETVLEAAASATSGRRRPRVVLRRLLRHLLLLLRKNENGKEGCCVTSRRRRR